MTLDDYQKRAHGTSGGVLIGHSKVAYPLLGLFGEIGELANKEKKVHRDGVVISDSDLIGELGDILWYLSELCFQYGFSLNDVAAYNLNKLAERKAKGTIHGNGDNR